MTTAVYTDAHTHFLSGKEAFSFCVRSVYNVSTWDELKTLPEWSLFSCGIHPCDLGKYDFSTITELAKETSCVAVGECGFDRPNDRETAFAQRELFERHAELSEKISKPLVIHCVRARGELLNAAKRFEASKSPWIIHGFRGSEKAAFELLERKFYLSFGRGLLLDEGAFRSYFKRIPSDRILLETDADALDVRKIYAVAADLCEISADEMREKVNSNFAKVFKVKI